MLFRGFAKRDDDASVSRVVAETHALSRSLDGYEAYFKVAQVACLDVVRRAADRALQDAVEYCIDNNFSNASKARINSSSVD